MSHNKCTYNSLFHVSLIYIACLYMWHNECSNTINYFMCHICVLLYQCIYVSHLFNNCIMVCDVLICVLNNTSLYVTYWYYLWLYVTYSHQHGSGYVNMSPTNMVFLHPVCVTYIRDHLGICHICASRTCVICHVLNHGSIHLL